MNQSPKTNGNQAKRNLLPTANNPVLMSYSIVWEMAKVSLDQQMGS